MSADTSNETLPQSKEGDIESENERQGVLVVIRQHLHSLKQLKSYEILVSALNIFKINPKFTFVVLLSILPLLFFMVFFEFKLQKSIIYASSNSLLQTQVIHVMTLYSKNSTTSNQTLDHSEISTKQYYSGGLQVNKSFVSDFFQIFIFYMFIYPLLEFLSMILTIKITARIQATDKLLTLREILHLKVKFKGPFIMYICVHVLSNMTLLGLFWVVANYYIFTGRLYFYYSSFYVHSEILISLSIVVHLGMFFGLLYKYLDWSVFWNLGVIISIMEEERTGIEPFALSEYYGKHTRKIGFQMMSVLFVFGNVPRVISLCYVFSNGSVIGVVIPSIVMVCFSLGNLVKWVAFLQYYIYCKLQTMGKKVDDQEIGKSASGDMP